MGCLFEMRDWDEIRERIINSKHHYAVISAAEAKKLAREFIKDFGIKEDHFDGFVYESKSTIFTFIASYLDNRGLYFSSPPNVWSDVFLLDALLETNKYHRLISRGKSNIFIELEKALESNGVKVQYG